MYCLDGILVDPRLLSPLKKKSGCYHGEGGFRYLYALIFIRYNNAAMSHLSLWLF